MRSAFREDVDREQSFFPNCHRLWAVRMALQLVTVTQVKVLYYLLI